MPGSASARSRSWPSDRAVDGGPGDRSVAKRIVRRHSGLAIAFVALRSPRRGRVARRSPSIAIVGRRLLGRFLLGDTRRALSCAATPLSWQRISPGASGFREREQAAALRAGACRLAAGCKQSTRIGLVATSRSVSDSDEIVLRGVQEQRESAARLPRLPKGRIDPPIGGPLPLRPDRLLQGCKHGFARVAAPLVKRSSREFGGNGCRVRTRSSSAAAGATVQPLDLAAKAGAGAVERRVLTSDLLDRDVALKQRVGLPDPPALPFGCRVGSCTGFLAGSRGRAFARASASRRTFTAP